MTTSVDTNVLVALWHPDHPLNTIAKFAMDSEMMRGNLVISPPVFVELLASPRRGPSLRWLKPYLGEGLRLMTAALHLPLIPVPSRNSRACGTGPSLRECMPWGRPNWNR